MTASINPIGIPLLDVGRDVSGRFRPGNRGGPGNPFARKVASLRKTLLDAVSEQDLGAMIEILKRQALEGDRSAIKLILQYCVGKPAPPNDPDRMDIDEWQRLRQMSVAHEQYEKTMDSVPACVACHLAQTAWPCTAQEGDGPLPHAIHHIHEELEASVQPAAEATAQPRAATSHPVAEPDAQAEPAVAAATHSPSAKGERKPNDRRERTGRSRRDSHAPAQPPSPNGGNEQEQQQVLDLLQRLWQPPQPLQQAEGEAGLLNWGIL